MKLVWDQIGEHFYHTGVDRGVVYPQASNGTYPTGAAWTGLTGVTESPSGAEKTDLFADNQKYLSMRSAEDFGATVTAYTYPDEFAQCDGSASPATGVKIGQQTRKPFGFCFRTLIGNDTEQTDYGYILHLVYGCTAAPSQKDHKSVNASLEAGEFSWEFATVPTNVTGYKPTAVLEIDSTKIAAAKLTALEKILYGDDGVATYTEFTGSAFVEGTDYYTRSGTEGHYVYTKTSDTEPAQGTTYYTKSVSGETTAYLPLPDDVIALVNAA